MGQIDSNKPTDRRGFFRHGLASLLGPLADMIEKRLDHVRQSFQSAMPAQDRLLRPPGALPEAQFLAKCQSCGKCASVCPVGAIYMTRRPGPARPGHRLADVTPVISPQSQPCVLCASLACMSACPSGALVPTAIDSIRMGAASWSAEHCLRTAGQDCQQCIEQCPRGRSAIGLADGPAAAGLAPIEVRYAGCAGCGSCESACPAEHKAILVYPSG